MFYTAAGSKSVGFDKSTQAKLKSPLIYSCVQSKIGQKILLFEIQFTILNYNLQFLTCKYCR